MRRNIELKARYDDLTRGHDTARRMGAVRQPDQHQIDTYFHVPRGRLKLREINGESAQLIAYHRPDDASPKGSDYTLVDVAQPSALKEALARTNGIWLVVDKKRAIYLWDNVRVHLDEVVTLGSFLEFEAVLNKNRNDSEGHAQLAQLSSEFGIDNDSLITGSYSDLLANCGHLTER